MEYDNATKVDAHKEVRHKFSDTAITEGLIEHKFSVYFPSNVANGSGGTYNSYGATIWEGISNGSTDLVALQFSLSASGYANLTYYGSSYGVSGSVATNIPFDKWISITTYANINTKTSSTSVSWDGTVQGQCTDVPWNSTSYNPTKLRHYIQKNAVNTLYYISDESVRHLSTQGMANADLNSLSVPSNPESDFTVATTGSVYGNTISWSNSSDALVVDGGNITLGDVATDTEVTLTASITLGGNTYTKDFVVTVPAPSDWETVINDDFNYASSTVLSTAYTDALPYKKDGDSNFNPGFLTYDGVNALKLQYDSSEKPAAHQQVYTKLSNTGLNDGIIEYKFNINIPKNAANTLGGTYNNNTSSIYIWEALSYGSSDILTLRFVANPASAISVGYVANNEANANVTTSMPFDTWATITAYLDTHSRTFKFDVAWNGTVQATSNTFEWRNNSKGYYPTDIRHYIQKNMPNALYYLSDLSVKTLSSQKAADADFDAATVPANPTEDFTVSGTGSVYGSEFTWSSTSPALLVDGTNVTLVPQATETDATLTATTVRNGNTYTRDYTVTVPKDSGITNIANEPFDYGVGATIGTATTDTMPWMVQNSTLDNFTPSIGGDANNNYLQIAVNPTITDTANHKSVQRTFYSQGAEGIVNYSLKLYVPSGVDNGAGGTYNTGGHNFWVSLIDNGGCEMLTYTAIIKNGAITIQHVPTTTVSGGSYAEAGVKSTFTFPLDTWITFNAQIDISEHSYVFTKKIRIKSRKYLLFCALCVIIYVRLVYYYGVIM